MRMSCNGCRVLRKGCSDSCTLRPCLEWIRSAEAQANATVFLAKFYGRSGLMKLLNSGPNDLKPIIFRSLLYEACGRMVNPIYGSVGLQWSGNWDVCQAAVESVLKGQHLQMQEENLESYVPLNISESSDIKPSLSQLTDSTFTDKPLKAKNPGRFKRPLRRKSRTHGDKLTVTTYSQEFESMFQIVEEGDAMKSCNNNQSVLGEATEIQPGQEAFEEIFHKNISDMENFSDDSHSRDMNENGVELELRLGSPVSQETGPPHHFAECKSHWSSMSSCKDPSLLNMASLSLALNHPV